MLTSFEVLGLRSSPWVSSGNVDVLQYQTQYRPRTHQGFSFDLTPLTPPPLQVFPVWMIKYSSTVTLEFHLLSSSTPSTRASLWPTRTVSGQGRIHTLETKCKRMMKFVTVLCVCCSFWDWEKGERLDYFYNGNPRYTRITAMEYLNGHDCSLLLTATGLRPTLTHGNV